MASPPRRRPRRTEDGESRGGALLPQLKSNAKRITGIHRLPVLGRRAIFPGPSPCQLERPFIESRASAALHDGRFGREPASRIDANAYGGNSLFSQIDRK